VNPSLMRRVMIDGFAERYHQTCLAPIFTRFRTDQLRPRERTERVPARSARRPSDQGGQPVAPRSPPYPFRSSRFDEHHTNRQRPHAEVRRLRRTCPKAPRLTADHSSWSGGFIDVAVDGKYGIRNGRPGRRLGGRFATAASSLGDVDVRQRRQ